MPKDAIRALLTEAGFDAVRFTLPALPAGSAAGLQAFLEEGRHGDMGWMESPRRASPLTIWQDVRSIIVVGHNYAPAQNPLTQLGARDHGLISCYARNADYHDVMKKKLRASARHIAERYGCEVKFFVDTAPVMEKPLAAQAGLGWQGKHSCVVSREFGSWLFLGEIFTTLPLAPDAPEPDHCGRCTRCLDICPTDAFVAPYQLDARKCISYLTIEHKGVIPLIYRRAIGNRIYGCDDCLAVCPWNKFAKTASEAAYHARATLHLPPLARLLALDDAAFRLLFQGSPIKRIGRDRFIRNVLIATGNSGNREYLPQLGTLAADASPLVRGMAAWATLMLATEAEFATLRASFLTSEFDDAVRAEWMHAPSP